VSHADGLDDGTPDGAGAPDGVRRQDKPLGRGLEDISHLFLSHRASEPPASSPPPPAREAERASPPVTPRGGMALLRPASVTRDRLTALLMEFTGAVEEGLRPIDASVPCHPCGEIDLLAVSRGSQLTIIDVETTVNDALALRGIAHVHWVMRHLPNVRRMYRDQSINFALQPRLVLLAPQFSPLLRSVARHMMGPHAQWLRYHTVESAGGTGILFEPVVGD
jgi:hypothetical protein